MNDLQAAVPALVIRRTFRAPRERVFTAWTDPQILAQWFAPPTIDFKTASCEARQGGTFRVELRTAEGEAYNVSGTYTEYREPERLAFTFRWEEDDPALEHDTLVSIDFAESNGGTAMTFTQERFASSESRTNHEGGWTQTFDKLAALFPR